MPNGIANPPDIIPPRWQDQITTVREVEELTGLDLLSNLPDEIENVIENRIYSGPTNVNDFPSVVT